MRREDLRYALLRSGIIPVTIELADDFDARIIVEDVQGLFIAHFRNRRAGYSVINDQFTPTAHLVGHPLSAVGTAPGCDVADVVGARLGDRAVVCEDQNVLLASLTNHSIEGGR